MWYRVYVYNSFLQIGTIDGLDGTYFDFNSLHEAAMFAEEMEKYNIFYIIRNMEKDEDEQ